MRPVQIDRPRMTFRSNFFPYLLRRTGLRDTALQSFELRIKAKDKVIREDMFVAYLVEWQSTPMQLWKSLWIKRYIKKCGLCYTEVNAFRTSGV